jgi:hypothetical protein
MTYADLFSRAEQQSVSEVLFVEGEYFTVNNVVSILAAFLKNQSIFVGKPFDFKPDGFVVGTTYKNEIIQISFMSILAYVFGHGCFEEPHIAALDSPISIQSIIDLFFYLINAFTLALGKNSLNVKPGVYKTENVVDKELISRLRYIETTEENSNYYMQNVPYFKDNPENLHVIVNAPMTISYDNKPTGFKSV